MNNESKITSRSAAANVFAPDAGATVVHPTADGRALVVPLLLLLLLLLLLWRLATATGRAWATPGTTNTVSTAWDILKLFNHS